MVDMLLYTQQEDNVELNGCNPEEVQHKPISVSIAERDVIYMMLYYK